jgi:hypothetical protein
VGAYLGKRAHDRRTEIKEILTCLRFLMAQVSPTDSVRAAMTRLTESATTEQERSALALADLKARRSRLMQDDAELAHQRHRRNFAAAKAPADATAKQRAEQATANGRGPSQGIASATLSNHMA